MSPLALMRGQYEGNMSQSSHRSQPPPKAPKVKSKKPVKPPKPVSRNIDLSQLRKPYETSVSGLKEAAKLLQTGTQEIKDLLTYEANLLYECRICRSIFRSLVNFLSHKRAFCKEKVSISSGNKSQDDNDKTASITLEDFENLDLDQIDSDQVTNSSKNGRILRSQASGKAHKKDLSSILDRLQKKQIEVLGESTQQEVIDVEESNCDQVVLQVLDSKRAVYQTLVEPNLSKDDLMGNQVMELENILGRDTVVLGADGQVEKSDSPVHFYGNEEANKLVCDICSFTFATQKTLNYHMKIKHASVRDCYLCPCSPCSSSFSSCASVKRHLTNVHRKIGPELKRLTQQTEKRTLRMKSVPTPVNKKSKKPEISGNHINESQNQVTLDSPEEIQNCSIDRRITEEAAVLRESTMINDSTCDIPDIEENLEEPSSPLAVTSSPVSSNKYETQNMSILVQGVSSLTEEDWEKLPGWSSENDGSIVSYDTIERPRPSIRESRVLATSQIVHASENNFRKRKFSPGENIGLILQGEKFKKVSSLENEAGKEESERVNAKLVSERIASISDRTKLTCIACVRTFTNITSLNRHMENHIKINRYRCNKCDFKAISRNDCVGHCNKMHNAQNNRQVLNEMISQISQDQLNLSDEMIAANPSNSNPPRLENMNSIASVLEQHDDPPPLLKFLENRREISISRLIPDSVNPYDTDTETEDREAVCRKIDSNPNLKEMIREVVIGTNLNIAQSAANSNLNGVRQSCIPNQLERSREINYSDYSPAIGDINITTEYPDEEDEISCEFYPKNGSNSMTRRRSAKMNESCTERKSESRMETRSSSRLGKKLDSDDEDEITRELNQSGGRTSSLRRSRSRASRRSDSRPETPSESKIMTRSRSRLGNQSFEEENGDYWKGYSKDLSIEEKTPRPKSRTGKQAKETRERSLSRQSRGKGRGRRSTSSKTNRSISGNREERSESFSSENSQVSRPMRHRTIHVDKDFIYDLEDDSSFKDLSYSPPAESGDLSSNGNQFAPIDGFNSNPSKPLVVEEIDGFPIYSLEDDDEDNSELFFLGFPRQPEILNVE